MRNILLVLMVIISSACTEEEVDKSDPDLVGSWRLIEALNDPGDGSGTFTPVNSEKIVVFSLEGTFTSNGDLCRPTTLTESPSSGIYNNESKFIIVNNCDNFEPFTRYIIEGENLIISGFGCIEGCSEKYRKLD